MTSFNSYCFSQRREKNREKKPKLRAAIHIERNAFSCALSNMKFSFCAKDDKWVWVVREREYRSIPQLSTLGKIIMDRIFQPFLSMCIFELCTHITIFVWICKMIFDFKSSTKDLKNSNVHVWWKNPKPRHLILVRNVKESNLKIKKIEKEMVLHVTSDLFGYVLTTMRHFVIVEW